MKLKKTQKKLELNRKTIARLNKIQTSAIHAGIVPGKEAALDQLNMDGEPIQTEEPPFICPLAYESTRKCISVYPVTCIIINCH